MLELLNEYLIEEALIIIPVLLILGTIIKGTPNIKDWLIPYILLVIGIVGTVGLLGFNVDAFLQGVLVTGGAVLINQGYKQVKEKGEGQ